MFLVSSLVLKETRNPSRKQSLDFGRFSEILEQKSECPFQNEYFLKA